jgi:hypothetical protein
MRSTAARKSGCSNCPRMPSESVRSKCPAPGNAGQTITQSVPSASATGSILPSGVESKVEHYLKTNCWHPCFCNHFSAASDCATASEAGTEHDFSATTPTSTEAAASRSEIPVYCTVRIPLFGKRVREITGACEIVTDTTKKHHSSPGKVRPASSNITDWVCAAFNTTTTTASRSGTISASASVAPSSARKHTTFSGTPSCKLTKS